MFTVLLLTKLPKLPIGNEKGAESAKTIQCFASMLLCGSTADRHTWESSISALNMLYLPDEILEQVAFVFSQEKMFCIIDNLSQVIYNLSTLSREPCRREGNRAPSIEAAQGNINLLILCNCYYFCNSDTEFHCSTYRWELSILKGLITISSARLKVHISTQGLPVAIPYS